MPSLLLLFVLPLCSLDFNVSKWPKARKLVNILRLTTHFHWSSTLFMYQTYSFWGLERWLSSLWHLFLLQRPGLDSSTHTYADNHLEHQFQEIECCLGCLWAAHTQGEWRECMKNIYTHKINQFKTLYVCYVHYVDSYDSRSLYFLFSVFYESSTTVIKVTHFLIFVSIV